MTPQRGLMFPPVNSEKAQNAIIRGGCLSAGCGKQGGGLPGHIRLGMLVGAHRRQNTCNALWDTVHRPSKNRARKIVKSLSKIGKSRSKNRVGRTAR